MVLRHLVRLLDDSSETVRAAVRAELEKSRKQLPDQIGSLDRPLTSEEERIMDELLSPSRREDLEDVWTSWLDQPTDVLQLEQAMALLATFLGGWKTHPLQLRRQLDLIAADVLEAHSDTPPDAKQLAKWMFGGKADSAWLSGNSADYYSPDNSNLLAVLATGLGNPLSLSVLYRLLGRRLGLMIDGCNFPGHFMARVEEKGEVWLVDCFNRGRFLPAEEVARHHPAASPAVEELIYQPAPAKVVVLRVLRNLEDAFDRRDMRQERSLIRRLTARTLAAVEERT
jgi:regulator of sirC expression with transglutaminase-like and TPR domain